MKSLVFSYIDEGDEDILVIALCDCMGIRNFAPKLMQITILAGCRGTHKAQGEEPLAIKAFR